MEMNKIPKGWKFYEKKLYLGIIHKVSTEYENPKCHFWTGRKINHWALRVAKDAIISIMQKAHLRQY